jgi:hypothetical protein
VPRGQEREERAAAKRRSSADDDVGRFGTPAAEMLALLAQGALGARWLCRLRASASVLRGGPAQNVRSSRSV